MSRAENGMAVAHRCQNALAYAKTDGQRGDEMPGKDSTGSPPRRFKARPDHLRSELLRLVRTELPDASYNSALETTNRSEAGQLVGEPNDLELAARAADGEKEAWNQLYERHEEWLRTLIQKLRLPRQKDVQARGISADDLITDGDLMNQVYLAVWEHNKLRSYSGKSEFRNWYAIVVRNIYNDMLRAKGLSVRAIEVDPLPESAAPDPAPGNETSRLFAWRLSSLAPRDRALIKITYALDLTSEEIHWIAKESRHSLQKMCEEIARLYATCTAEQQNHDEEATRLEQQATAKYTRILELQAELDALLESPNRRTEAMIKLLTEQIASFRRQHGQLLDRARRLLVRVPSKEVGQLIGMSQMYVDTQLSRIRMASRVGRAQPDKRR
jgi:RNA polymerase sigma factor (sigma-70 family)